MSSIVEAVTYSPPQGSNHRCRVLHNSLAALVERARNGDKTALRKLLIGLTRPILASSRRILGSSEDAEDAAQEALLTISRRLNNIKDPQAVYGYARVVASRAALEIQNRRVHNQRSLDLAQAEFVEPAGLGTHSVALDQERRRTRIRQHVIALPRDQSRVLQLKYFCGHSFAEIAEIEEIGPNTARSRAYRGKAALRERIARDPHFACPGHVDE